MTTRIGMTLFWEANPPATAGVRGPWKFTLNQCYLRLFEGMDVVPLGILPGGRASQAVREVSGIVMTGGGDPAPELFGRTDEGSRDPEVHRPLWEMDLYREARAAGIPVLAVCLGMQLVAIAEGGALIQDIASSVPGALDHQAGLHEVSLSPGSGLHRLLGGGAMVFSAHHQAVERVPSGFIEAAVSSDGILEAIQSRDGMVTAVQWHPERDGTGSVLAREFIRVAGAGS